MDSDWIDFTDDIKAAAKGMTHTIKDSSCFSSSPTMALFLRIRCRPTKLMIAGWTARQYSVISVT